jgi:hypothetical protein
MSAAVDHNRKVVEAMLSPSFFGSDMERRVRELRALPDARHVRPGKSPRKRHQRRRFRAALGARMIVWGESLRWGVSEAQIRRFGGQPT